MLWQHLRKSEILGRKFRRQEPIGPYIVDFICFDPMLVIEIDGWQHTECMAYDSERSAFSGGKGFKVIRFWNHEVLAQTDRVRAIRQRPPPNPLPSGGGMTGYPPVGRECYRTAPVGTAISKERRRFSIGLKG